MRFEGFFKQEMVQGRLIGYWKGTIRIFQTRNFFFLISALNNVRETANQTSMASNLSLKSFSEFLNRTGVSNIEAL